MKAISAVMLAICTVSTGASMIVPAQAVMAQPPYTETFAANGVFNGREYTSVTVNYQFHWVCFNFADGGRYTFDVEDPRMFAEIVARLSSPDNVSGD